MLTARLLSLLFAVSLLPLTWVASAAPTGKRFFRIERIVLKGNTKTHRSVVLARLRFKVGDVYDESALKRSRLRLLVSGFFQDVDFKVRRGRKPKQVVITVLLKERGSVLIDNLFLGSSKRTPIWAGLSLTEKNFLGRGFSLNFAGVFSRHQQGFRFRFSDPMFVSKPLLLEASIMFNNGQEFLVGRDGTIVNGTEATFADVRYRRLGARLGFGIRLGSYVSLMLSYRFEGISTKAPDLILERVNLAGPGAGSSYTRYLPLQIERGRSYLSAIQLFFLYQTLRSPFLPHNGTRITFLSEVAHTVSGSDYSYAKFILNIDQYWRLPWRHVISLHLFGGFIVGNTPFFNKFFIGDLHFLVPGRDLELNFSDRRPPAILSSSLKHKRYENRAARLLLGYAIPLYRGSNALYKADFYFAFGALTLGSEGKTGSTNARFPIDLTFDLGFRFDTPVGVFSLTFSNLVNVVEF